MSLLESLPAYLRRLRTPRSEALMIVGMHRSGTSFLTGSLQQAGLELGQHSAWNPHNLRGNRENQEIVNFHDEVLAARGYAWDAPPPGPVEWTSEEYARARQLIACYADVPRWGFKDPRALLLVEGWRMILPRLRFIGIFRHPAAVARSLHARGGMPEEKAFMLWRAYNLRLLALHDTTRFPLLCFDQSEDALHAKLDEALRSLGLRELNDGRFFTPELKHHQDVPDPLPPDLEQLYARLLARAR